MRCTQRVRATLALVLLLLASCAGGSPPERTPDRGPVRSPPGLFEPRITSAPRTWSCVTTLPNRDNPPGQESRFSHGNGHLWVELWPQGHVRATPDDVRPDGSITVKVPWTRGVSGWLTITGKRLDAQAPPARAFVPDYGRRGFQSSLVVFPTPGCWQVTGRVGGVSLTFVIKVIAPVD